MHNSTKYFKHMPSFFLFFFSLITVRSSIEIEFYTIIYKFEGLTATVVE